MPGGDISGGNCCLVMTSLMLAFGGMAGERGSFPPLESPAERRVPGTGLVPWAAGWEVCQIPSPAL